jgi:hypothetical protein
MSGFRILDTYRAYKVQEKRFTGWLQSAAGELGYGGKNSKSHSSEGDNPIRINEIPSLTKLIVSRGQSIPETLRQVLRDVISRRKEASALYRPQGNRKADEGHAHYIQVLEGALKLFESANSSGSSSKAGPSRTAGGAAASSQSSMDRAFNNVFDMLRLQDGQNGVAEAELSGSDSGGERGSDKENQQSPAAAAAAKKGKKKIRFGKRKGKSRKARKSDTAVIVRQPVTDVEIFDAMVQTSNVFDEDEDDLYFMIYCFFKDFNTLREYVQERWCNYQEGLLSLSAVSVTTNTAFEYATSSSISFPYSDTFRNFNVF